MMRYVVSEFQPAEYDQPDPLIDVLVAQALDDLDEGRFDVQTALRVIASLAWAAARDRYLAACGGPPTAANDSDPT
jgi:hypothetical protein